MKVWHFLMIGLVLATLSCNNSEDPPSVLISDIPLVPDLPPGDEPPEPPDPPGTNDMSLFESQIFNLINDYRISQGRSPLTWNETIQIQARDHSENMADGSVAFGHGGFQARVDAIRLVLGGVAFAENVAMNFSTDPQSVVNQWVASTGHRNNILGPYSLSGLSAKQASNGAWYYAQIFLGY